MPKRSKRATEKGAAGKGSSTAGRMKGPNCQKNQLKNQYCLDTRFYKKDPINYQKVCMMVDGLQK